MAGTPTSLSAINLQLKEYDDSVVEGSTLSLNIIDNFISNFAKLTPSQILDKYGQILKGREDVILAGTFILKSVTEILGNDKVFVSGRGIRYGSIIDFLNNLQW